MENTFTFSISEILEKDEKIVWQGRPIKGISPTTYGCVVVPLLLLSFLVFYQNKLDLLMPLLIVIFLRYLALTCYYVFGSKYRGKLFYTLTNNRVIIFSRKGLLYKSYKLSEYDFLLCFKRKNGVGSIRINKSRATNLLFCIVDRYIINPLQPSLRLINEVGSVHNLINKTKENLYLTKP